jgi:hypothetical protein
VLRPRVAVNVESVELIDSDNVETIDRAVRAGPRQVGPAMRKHQMCARRATEIAISWTMWRMVSLRA